MFNFELCLPQPFRATRRSDHSIPLESFSCLVFWFRDIHRHVIDTVDQHKVL